MYITLIAIKLKQTTKMVFSSGCEMRMSDPLCLIKPKIIGFIPFFPARKNWRMTTLYKKYYTIYRVQC